MRRPRRRIAHKAIRQSGSHLENALVHPLCWPKSRLGLGRKRARCWSIRFRLAWGGLPTLSRYQGRDFAGKVLQVWQNGKGALTSPVRILGSRGHSWGGPSVPQGRVSWRSWSSPPIGGGTKAETFAGRRPIPAKTPDREKLTTNIRLIVYLSCCILFLSVWGLAPREEWAHPYIAFHHSAALNLEICSPPSPNFRVQFLRSQARSPRSGAGQPEERNV